jgi:hypothetical protein
VTPQTWRICSFRITVKHPRSETNTQQSLCQEDKMFLTKKLVITWVVRIALPASAKSNRQIVSSAKINFDDEKITVSFLD